MKKDMRADNWFMRIWKIIYPMLIFLLISQIVVIVSLIVMGAVIMLKNSYSEMDTMAIISDVLNSNMLLITLFTHIATIPILYWFYKRDKKKIYLKSQVDIVVVVFVAILAICACIGVNTLVSISGLPKLFPNDLEETSQALYSEAIWVQILAMVIGAPIVEELIFRGLIFKRMRTYCGFLSAAIVSSLCFGVFHGRIIQGVYGFIIGFILAAIFEKTKSLKMCILFHLVANATSVALTNVKVLEQIYANFAILISGICVVVGCIIAILLNRHKISNREE